MSEDPTQRPCTVSDFCGDFIADLHVFRNWWREGQEKNPFLFRKELPLEDWYELFNWYEEGEPEHAVEFLMRERAKDRPESYPTLSPAAQWEVDKQLGILDWKPAVH